jgi:SOS response regulatory protein OraA/RecX
MNSNKMTADKDKISKKTIDLLKKGKRLRQELRDALAEYKVKENEINKKLKS